MADCCGPLNSCIYALAGVAASLVASLAALVKANKAQRAVDGYLKKKGKKV